MQVKRLAWIKRLKASQKVLLCLATSLLFLLIIPWNAVDGSSHVMISWIVFCFSILILDWIVFLTTSAQQTRDLAWVEDGSLYIVFIIVLIATIASLLVVGLLLIQEKDENRLLHVLLAVPSMFSSWLLVHTIFTVRYAHLYYGDHKMKGKPAPGGLSFPENDLKKDIGNDSKSNVSHDDGPDFIDFAYFSFVLGMTFQVSDVQVTSRRLRRLVLAHSLLSFVYNTILLALTINTLAK